MKSVINIDFNQNQHKRSLQMILILNVLASFINYFDNFLSCKTTILQHKLCLVEHANASYSEYAHGLCKR